MSKTKTILFIAVFSFIALGINNVFKFKYTDGIYSIKTFYKQPKNSIDVLILGSSTAFENVNPAVLYERYGIAAFNLCGSVQPVWNSFFYLKEALKTQQPRLVIFDAFRTVAEADYIDDSRIIKNTYGMRWSMDKIEALRESAPKDRFLDFLVGPLQYHGRYKELDEKDFLPYLADEAKYKHWKGFYCNMNTLPSVRRDISNVEAPVRLSEKTEKYYRKLIELVKSENIPLMVIVAPYSHITGYQQRKYLEAKKIASEYDVPFINYNLLYDDIGLDFKTDIADKSHLNYRGSRKFTEYLGKYLNDNYDLPDRRGDENYHSYDMNLKHYKESIRMAGVKRYRNFKDYMAKIPFSNCVSIVTVSDLGAWDRISAETVNMIAPEGIFTPSVIVRHGDNTVFSAVNTDSLPWHKRISSRDFAVRSKDGRHYVINIGAKEYQTVEEGVNVVIYNTYTNEVVDAVGFDAKRDFALVRKDGK